MIGRSLHLRLLTAAAFWMVLALVGVGVVLTVSFRDSIERSHTLRMAAVLRALVAVIEINPKGLPEVTHPIADPRFDQVYSGWYWQIGTDDGPLVRSRSLWDFSLPLLDHATTPTVRTALGGGAASPPTYVSTVEGPDGAPIILLERELAFEGGVEPLHISVGAALSDVQKEVTAFQTVLLASFGLLAALMLMGMLVQIRFGLRPLDNLTRDIARLHRQAGRRLNEGYPQEIMPLVREVNAVLDRDFELMERSRTRLGNLAHALKTPLAVIQAEVSSARPDRSVVEQKIHHMTAIIERQLAGARAEAISIQGRRESVAVAPVLEGLAGALRKIYDKKNLVLEVTAASDLAVDGDPEELAEILGNLMDNACKWARQRILVTAQGQDGTVVLTVEDDGPGMTEEQCRIAMKRGTRLDESTPGSGLGLSIVAELMDLHHGQLYLDRGPLGGLRVRLEFPSQGTGFSPDSPKQDGG